MTSFDGDNTYPDCRQCGGCCEIGVLCVSPEEVEVMRAYIAEHDIQPIDYQHQRCPFQRADRRCSIWPARPQTCRLATCQMSREEILAADPSIIVDDSKPLIELHECFFNGDASDPRTWPAGDPRFEIDAPSECS